MVLAKKKRELLIKRIIGVFNKPDSVIHHVDAYIGKLATIYLCGIPVCLTGTNNQHTLLCLAPDRVCPSSTLLHWIGCSYHPFSPLPSTTAVIFCGTFRKPSGFPLLRNNLFKGIVFVWSPDFPLVNTMFTSDCLFYPSIYMSN